MASSISSIFGLSLIFLSIIISKFVNAEETIQELYEGRIDEGFYVLVYCSIGSELFCLMYFSYFVFFLSEFTLTTLLMPFYAFGGSMFVELILVAINTSIEKQFYRIWLFFGYLLVTLILIISVNLNEKYRCREHPKVSYFILIFVSVLNIILGISNTLSLVRTVEPDKINHFVDAIDMSASGIFCVGSILIFNTVFILWFVYLLPTRLLRIEKRAFWHQKLRSKVFVYEDAKTFGGFCSLKWEFLDSKKQQHFFHYPKTLKILVQKCELEIYKNKAIFKLLQDALNFTETDTKPEFEEDKTTIQPGESLIKKEESIFIIFVIDFIFEIDDPEKCESIISHKFFEAILIESLQFGKQELLKQWFKTMKGDARELLENRFDETRTNITDEQSIEFFALWEDIILQQQDTSATTKSSNGLRDQFQLKKHLYFTRLVERTIEIWRKFPEKMFPDELEEIMTSSDSLLGQILNFLRTKIEFHYPSLKIEEFQLKLIDRLFFMSSELMDFFKTSEDFKKIFFTDFDLHKHHLATDALREFVIEWNEKYPKTKLPDSLLYSRRSKFESEMLLKKISSGVTEIFLVGERLGRGGFGNVYKVQRKKDGQIFAMKLCKHDSTDEGMKGESWAANLPNSEENHIIEMLGFYQELTNRKSVLLMNVCEGGDLSGRLYPKSINPRSEFELFKQLIKGVKFLHQHKIIHRDLKPSNILLKNPSRDWTKIVITDFGLAIPEEELEEKNILEKASGTHRYFPPGEQDKKSNWSTNRKEWDIWALGCIFFEIYFATEKLDDSIAFSYFENKPSWNDIKIPQSNNTDDFMDTWKPLIESCWCRDSKFATIENVEKILFELRNPEPTYGADSMN